MFSLMRALHNTNAARTSLDWYGFDWYRTPTMRRSRAFKLSILGAFGFPNNTARHSSSTAYVEVVSMMLNRLVRVSTLSFSAATDYLIRGLWQILSGKQTKRRMCAVQIQELVVVAPLVARTA